MPCAGPVLAAVTIVAANQNVGVRSVALTLAYALGAAIPMIAIALGGQRVALRLRGGATRFRQAMGVLIALSALAIALGADTRFQTALPGYTNWLQNKLERNSTAQRALAKVVHPRATQVKAEAAGLPDFGPAPNFIAGGRWFNSAPLNIAATARQGRPRRLLDVHLHQLPAHAAAPRGVGRDATARRGS